MCTGIRQALAAESRLHSSVLSSLSGVNRPSGLRCVGFDSQGGKKQARPRYQPAAISTNVSANSDAVESASAVKSSQLRALVRVYFGLQRDFKN